MILGIASPVWGEREGRKSPWAGHRLWLAHSAGGAVGGAVIGGLVAMAGVPFQTLISSPVRTALALAIAALAILFDIGLVRPPHTGRQVPATWTAEVGPVRAFAYYGAILGAGLLTFVPIGLTYALAAFGVLVLPPLVAVVAFVAFGAARTIATGPLALRPVSASALLYRQPRYRRWWRTASLCVVALLGGLVLLKEFGHGPMA